MIRTPLSVVGAWVLVMATSGASADEPRKPAAGAPREPDPQRVLDQFDKNKDGFLDPSEAPRPLRQRFEQFDLNHDGKLDRDELQKAMLQRAKLAGGQPKRPPEPGQGRGAMNDRTDDRPDGAPRDPLFQLLDTDGDGRLSAEELRDAPRLLAKRDRNKDGMLDRDEMVAGLRGGGGRPGEYIAPAAKGERQKDTVQVGDPAPDFTLPDLTGQKQIALSSFRGRRPVVLVFASYT